MRKIKNWVYAIGLCTLLYGCKDASVNDLSGNATFTGTVMLYDTLSGSYAYKLLPAQVIYLKYNTQTSGYLYSVPADNSAMFTFSPIDASKSYTMYSSLAGTAMNYYGELNYPLKDATKDTLKLVPDNKTQNGLYYNLFDNKGGRLPNANCYIYTNQTLWANKDTTNYTYLIKSDPAGRVLKINIAPAVYYIYAREKFAGAVVVATDTMGVTALGIRRKKMVLQ
ncbi:MAG: hypothetical protein JWR38_4309 [Mucilaginibacter sp.]|nr:hypothetical protein [Mucilaginibacter sp.]